MNNTVVIIDKIKVASKGIKKAHKQSKKDDLKFKQIQSESTQASDNVSLTDG